MTLNVLISCMFQVDKSIIERSNIQSDVIVVNQCDCNSIEEFDFVNKKGAICHVRFISTTERGLSKSRNMALRNAWGDICLICDDDEVLADDYEKKIIEAYLKYTDSDLIAFALIRADLKKTYPEKAKFLNFKQILRTSSQQITFRRRSLVEHGIIFDEKMGSGTGNGGGEEIMLMLLSKRCGLKLLYCPSIIATIKPSSSQWFHGYTERYFENLGWTDRRILGPILGFLYLIYWPIFRRSVYSKDGLSVYRAIKCSLKGYCSKR